MDRRTFMTSPIDRLHWWTLCLFAIGSLLGKPLSAQQMIFPGESWQMATPESVLIDSQKLEAAVAELDRTAKSVEEMVIVRNGRVIWQGNNVDYSQQVYSMTKSFTSTVMGLLVDDGVVTLDTLVKDYVPSMAAEYPDATLRHFATHTNGYLAVDEQVPLAGGNTPPQDFLSPGSPLFSPPGSQFAYTGAAMDMWGYALTRAAGESLEDLFNRRVATPIAMDPDGWDWGELATDDGVVVNGGSGYVDGMVINAKTAARLGHLFLNDGNWDGQQLVSSGWANDSTQVQVAASIPLHSQSATNGPGEYGYGWWVGRDWYSALGAFYNWISVNPDAGIVFARLGNEAGFVNRDSFERQLTGAIIPAVWDQNGDGRWDEFQAATGKPRWKTENGVVPDIYPTGEAIIRSDMVTVADDLQIRTLAIESGGVSINESVNLSSSNQIRVEAKALLTVGGIIEANHIAINGGQFDINGSASLDRLTMSGGGLRIAPDANVKSRLLTQSGGKLIVNGNVELGRLKVTDGLVEVHGGPSPYVVTDRFELKGETELQFLVGANWTSPISIGPSIAPKLSGTMVLDFAATDDPKQFEGQTVNLLDWSDDVEPEGEFAQIVSPSRTQWDVSRIYETGEVVLQSVLEKPVREGDFNGDGVLESVDIDELTRRTRVASRDNYFDANADGSVTQQDLDYWVHDLAKTYFGDSNLDGEFNSGDLIQVFAAGQYEDRIPMNSTWTVGDWNGDGDFDSGDLVVAFTDGGYELGPRGEARAVPEPSCLVGLFLSLVIVSPQWRRRRRTV